MRAPIGERADFFPGAEEDDFVAEQADGDRRSAYLS
jgi:hypothetical protein